MSLINLERFITKEESIKSRLFLREEEIQFGYIDESQMNPKKEGNTPIIPIGTYELGLRYDPKLSKVFYYNQSENKILSSVEYKKLDVGNNKMSYKQHDLIYLRDINTFENVYIYWDNVIDENYYIVVGKILGICNNEERVLQNRFGYMDSYTTIFSAIKKGRSFITIK